MTTDTSLEAIAELRERVMQFKAMRLPGQPMGVHMGTSYLVGDLDRTVAALSARVAELEALARRITEDRDHDKDRAEAAEARVAEWRAEYETSDNMHKLYKRRCAELVSELNDAVAQAHDTGFERERWKARAEAAEAALADARDKERVSVKPLEWDASTAQAPFWSEYEVQKTDNGFWVAMLSGSRVARGLTSEAEAKAAAYADKCARVRAEIVQAADTKPGRCQP